MQRKVLEDYVKRFSTKTKKHRVQRTTKKINIRAPALIHEKSQESEVSRQKIVTREEKENDGGRQIHIAPKGKQHNPNAKIDRWQELGEPSKHRLFLGVTSFARSLGVHLNNRTPRNGNVSCEGVTGNEGKMP